MTEITHVIKRSGALVPFNSERIINAIYRAAVAVGNRDRDLAERLGQEVVEVLEETGVGDYTPTVEEIQDIVERVLVQAGNYEIAKAYILYRDEHSRRRRTKLAGSTRDTSSNIPYRKIYETLNWAMDHDLHRVESLNARIARGEFADIVAESEQYYEDDVAATADMVLARRDEVRVAIISGPSSSGKTTTTIKLGEHLEEAGLELVALEVDNYFYDLEMHPVDEFGDYDYETPQALDLELINEHLVRLLQGEEVLLPHYDFRTGTRTLDHTPMRVKPNQIILIDSLHGLYKDMTADVPDETKFKLYIETLLQMKDAEGHYVRWTDLRLMRRMVRDSIFRAYQPEQTLLHWHYVRSSELRHIVPYANTADYIVNSALPYEMSIMRPRLLDHFAEWAEKYDDDPLRQDACNRAQRVHKLLQSVMPVEDDDVIGPYSLMREFIGGSAYDYE
jgi:uridine kinase